MRIADEDRQRAVDELGRHCSAGRLDVDAYADRLAEAMSAETLADVDHALRDLPRLRIADPRPRPPLLAPHRPGSGGGDGPELARWPARLVLVVSALLAVAGAVFIVLAQWVWLCVLVVSWVAGVAQGRVTGWRRRW